jgi:hypothetical protein
MFLDIVETKGLSLEETAALFDGEEAQNTIAQHRTDGAHAIISDEKNGPEKASNSFHETSPSLPK